ncbi:MAG: transporter substrate-binding domain-containing protein, partial [Verrucomicrobiota bacterium]|nr:transporter substrate-binding domain-containing protein [Verrucomicrobiota bacterium]
MFFIGFGATALGEPAIKLTPSELAWIAGHPNIRVGYDPDWPPFSFNTGGKFQGIDANVLDLISRRLGLHFKIVTAPTWSAVYNKALARKVDMLVGTARTPEREPFFIFTAPYLSFPVAIITRTDAPFLWSAQDFTGRKIAAPRDYAPTLSLQREFPDLSLILTDTEEEAMQLVARGKADATIDNLAVASFIIKTRGLTNLKIAGFRSHEFELRYAVRRDWPELAGILDKGITSLSPADLQGLTNQWIHVDYTRVVRWDIVWKIIAGIVLVAGLIIWFIEAHVRRLARELEERARLQRKLEESHEQLTRLNEEKAELLRMAVHDLRNPLTGIQLALDLAREGVGGPEETLGRVRYHSEQMMHLLKEMLGSQAIESGERRLDIAPVDAAAMLREAVAAMLTTAERKDIRLDTGGIDATPPALADKSALRQVIDNLLSNALKFSPPRRTVRVVLREWNGRVRIEVHDQGPGVKPDEVERIFAKYARGSAKPTGGEKSTGLGLSIIRQLVTAMNGRAWCESGQGQGAV